MLDTLLSGINLGLIWAILALGVYISFRILNIADLSCEGVVTCGASIGAMCIYLGVNPILATLASFVSGCLAGMLTGFLITKVKIQPILAGILTMTALFSINIHIMSLARGIPNTSNLTLLNHRESTLYGAVLKLFGLTTSSKVFVSLGLGVLIVGAVIALLYWFFGTELGSAIRATGVNGKMCRAQGINTDRMKVIALALSNGLIAMSGSLIAQYNNYSEITMGIGAIVIGLASIIIGETIFAKAVGFLPRLIGVVVGSIIYRIVISYVVYFGVSSANMKLITAAIVAIALALPALKAWIKRRKRKTASAPVTTAAAEIAADSELAGESEPNEEEQP